MLAPALLPTLPNRRRAGCRQLPAPGPPGRQAPCSVAVSMTARDPGRRGRPGRARAAWQHEPGAERAVLEALAVDAARLLVAGEVIQRHAVHGDLAGAIGAG